MSNTQIAFISRSSVPDRGALQASIDRLGFNLTLPPEFTSFEDSGFLPCVLDGTSDVGFEVFYAPTTEVADGDRNLIEIAAGRDFSISMVWHGSMKDCACAMIVSCALATDFGAVISYEGEAPEPFDALLENANSIVGDSAREQPRNQTLAPGSGPVTKKPWWRIW